MWFEVNEPSADSPGRMLAPSFEPGTSARAIAPSPIEGPGAGVGAHHLAIDHIEHGGRRLQQFGGGLDRLRSERGRSDPRCFPGHDGYAGGERAHAVLDAVGVAVDDAHASGSRRRAHRRRSARARSRCLGRPTRSRTPPRPSLARSTLIRTSSSGPSPLFSTNRATPAPTSSPAARRWRVFRGAAAIRPRRAPCRAARHSRRNRARSRCRAYRAGARRASPARDQVAPAHLDAIDAQPRGDRIEQPLAHERALEAAGRAVGAARRLVGQPNVHVGAIGRHAIRARAASPP